MKDTKHLWENHPHMKLRASPAEVDALMRGVHGSVLHLGVSTAFDFSKMKDHQVVDYVRYDFYPHEIIVDDWRTMVFPDNSFDFIIADGSFNCLPIEDYENVLQRCAKALKVGGEFRVRLYTNRCEVETPRLLSKPKLLSFIECAQACGFGLRSTTERALVSPIVVCAMRK